MRYTHLDQMVKVLRQPLNLPIYNPRLTTHMNVLDVRHEAFSRFGGACDFLMIIIKIEDEKYTCFADTQGTQLHIVHEPSENYEPLKPYDDPALEEQIKKLLVK